MLQPNPPPLLARVGFVFFLGLALVGSSAAADEPVPFKPMFNGKDLSGWVPINVAPNTFTVRDGMIVSTGVPTGLLRTERMYENFILEMEWRHLRPGGNAGLFVWGDPLTAPGTPFARGIEVQILDGRETASYTSHGDIFSIHGATCVPARPHPGGWPRCLPSEKRCKPSPEWNHYRVVARDGVIKLSVNGKEVSEVRECSPRKGYLHLESEGSECHFRNLRIHELPSSNPPAGQVARAAESGWKNLYTGIDLTGWKAEPAHREHWLVRDWMLKYDGQCRARDPNLWTEKEYGDFELIADWRLSGRARKIPRPVFGPDGLELMGDDGRPKTEDVLDAGESGIYLRGTPKCQVNAWCWPSGSGEIFGYRTDRTLPPEVRRACIPTTKADKPPGAWNRFHIRMKGEMITVDLNGVRVINEVRLPNVPRRGAIGLQHFGHPVEFANLLIKELE
jgi:hypothetical protein